MTPTSRTRLLGIAACAAGAFALAASAGGGEREAGPPAPPLEARDGRCADLATPERRARASEVRASSHMARFAFRPEQGLAALEALSEAADCHLRAGDTAAAERVRRERSAWHARVERDYRDRRLHLARALRREDPDAARRAAERLLALLGDREDAYTRRLHALVDAAAPAVAEAHR